MWEFDKATLSWWSVQSPGKWQCGPQPNFILWSIDVQGKINISQ